MSTPLPQVRRVVTPAAAAADLARRAAHAAEGVPGVAALTAGGDGTCRTGTVRGPIVGVRRDSSATRVAVVARPGHRLPELAEAVRQVVAAVTGHPVDVEIADLDTTGPTGRPHPVPSPRPRAQEATS